MSKERPTEISYHVQSLYKGFLEIKTCPEPVEGSLETFSHHHCPLRHMLRGSGIAIIRLNGDNDVEGSTEVLISFKFQPMTNIAKDATEVSRADRILPFIQKPSFVEESVRRKLDIEIYGEKICPILEVMGQSNAIGRMFIDASHRPNGKPEFLPSLFINDFSALRHRTNNLFRRKNIIRRRSIAACQNEKGETQKNGMGFHRIRSRNRKRKRNGGYKTSM